MLPLVSLISCQHGGNGQAHPRTFKLLFSFVDSRFLVRGFQVQIFLIMALKNWAGMDSFPIHQLNQFKCSEAVLGPTHRFTHFFLRALNEG